MTKAQDAAGQVLNRPCEEKRRSVGRWMNDVWRALKVSADEAEGAVEYIGTATEQWTTGTTIAVSHAELGAVVVNIWLLPFKDPNIQNGDEIRFKLEDGAYLTSRDYNDEQLLTLKSFGGTVGQVRPGWALANGVANSMVLGGDGFNRIIKDYSTTIHVDGIVSYDRIAGGEGPIIPNTPAISGDQIQPEDTGTYSDNHTHPDADITGSTDEDTSGITGSTGEAVAGIEVDDHSSHTHANTVANHVSHTHAVSINSGGTELANGSDKSIATPTDAENPSPQTHTVTPVTENATLTHTVNEGIFTSTLNGVPTFDNPYYLITVDDNIFGNAEVGDTITIGGNSYTVAELVGDNSILVTEDATVEIDEAAISIATGGHIHGAGSLAGGSHDHGSDLLGIDVGMPDTDGLGGSQARVHDHLMTRQGGTAAILFQRVY